MEYDIEKIRQMAARYYDGDTSVEEENILREFFGSMQMASVPKDLQGLAKMIHGFRSMSEERMPGRHGVKRIVLTIVSVAAVVVLIVFHPASSTVYGYDADGRKITDPEEAVAMSAPVFSDLSALGATVDSAEEIIRLLND